ncbi:MAG: polysaccharide deacetylase family protein [Actinobacteria bacterium]|nr:polysaccharide deacetylase family protein [Actinomycetota bacterium]MCL6105065.1 polysaccharide deacetylase family protein [Actinomycetota bacterium]
MSNLAERLGYKPDDRLLIINCDDLGFCHSSNIGVYESMRNGVATTATLMVPCPWAREAAANYRGDDVGVHLTLNSEWDVYRWASLSHSPSLLDGDGGLPRTIVDVWEHADIDEVRRECKTQIERAIYWGFDVTHIDSHMGTLQLKPEFFDIYLEMAVEFSLPMRLSGPGTEWLIGFPFRQLAQEAGVIFPDNFIFAPTMGSRPWILQALDTLEPGVTEAYLHPAVDSPELRAAAPDFQARVDDYNLVALDNSFKQKLQDLNITLIGYRPLRELMRSQKA